MAYLQILVGFTLLILGAEVLVKGASRLAAAVGISSLVIGLTVVAFGTSAPELAVSVAAGLGGSADIALGNVVGSNIVNVLFILGISALIVPLSVDTQLVRLDVPVMVGVSGLTWLFALDGEIQLVEGFILVAGIIIYTLFLYFMSRRAHLLLRKEAEPSAPPAERSARAIGISLLLVVIGLALLILGSRFLVDGAVALATSLGVSQLVISLTVVAIGTSMPEVFTSVVAGLRGQRDIAVGNIVGSNIFNLLSVLGLTAVVSGGVRVAPQALHFDIPVMVAVAIICVPIFFTHGRISRWEGGLLLFYYLAYLTYLVFVAIRSPVLEMYDDVVIGMVLPLTLLALAWSVFDSIQRKKRTLSI